MSWDLLLLLSCSQHRTLRERETLIPTPCFQYVTPVIKYDRNGFKARDRLLVLTQSSAYVVEMAKIKQKIDYATLKGNGGTSLSASDPGGGKMNF